MKMLLIIGFYFFYNLNFSQTYFTQVDKFENVWVINDSRILCLDKNSRAIGEYSNLELGKPTSIDVTNPFKILVFFQSTQALIFLNNKVTQLSDPIFLTKKGISEVTAVCRSSKGGIWIYNRTNNELRLFDDKINSSTFKIILNSEYSEGKVEFIQTQSDLIYIGFRNKNIVKYNEYGQYLGELPFKSNKPLFFFNSEIYYTFNKESYIYSIDSNIIKKIQAGCTTYSGLIVLGENYFYYDGSKLVKCEVSN